MKQIHLRGLEIEKNRQPDWEAARRHVSSQAAHRLKRILREVCGEEEANNQPFWVKGEEDFLQTLFQGIVSIVENAWLGKREHGFARFDLDGTVIIAAKEATSGGNREAAENLKLFINSGAAEKAGFRGA
ncbi:hypothetical protein HQ520_04090 [bacterium]|nr:hypothetical protein [bacterium]